MPQNNPLHTALVIGSTGMVGRELIKQLCESSEFEQVISFVRRSSGFSHSKLQEHVVNFDQPESWKELLKGDVLFSCMGTTLAAAGSKASQYKVDYTYQYETARMAAENNVPVYVLVSSTGANANSALFYPKIKGQLDEAVQKLGFKSVQILRPGQLYGERQQKRSAELFAVKMMFAMNSLGIFKKYKPIHASEVAKAMISAAKRTGSNIFTLDELFKLPD
ncbi:MAG: NAD-dependent epimerase/dehydratase family protein [Bacteroidia bacterium]|nr:NAD-dependent epimerase/dehydratase family protein [Bacteroidia bacterium]